MDSGIYKIINLETGKYYVGSTKDFKKRKQSHFSRLKNNNHKNKHLQFSYNKYGIDSFKFEIVDYVDKNLLLDVEQSYIDNSEKENIYNQTYIAGAGGYDILSIETYILDLNGNIINKYSSISETSRVLGIFINTPNVNTSQISLRKYRIVTKDFYDSNLELILSWNNVSDPNRQFLKIKGENYILKQILIYNNKEYSSKKELAKELPITIERIRQILISGKSKKFDIKYKHPELN